MKVTKKQKALVWFCLGYSKTYIRKELRLKAKKLNQWIKDEIEPTWLEKEKESLSFDEIIKKKVLYLISQKVPKDIIGRYLKINDVELYNMINKKADSVKSINFINTHTARQPGRTAWLSEICNKNKAVC